MTPTQCLQLFCLFYIVCLGSSFAQDDRTPLIVDTDMGLDDVRSITLLLHSPDFRLVGIVVTEGASDTDSALGNLQRLLAHFDSSHIPIIRGLDLDLAAPPWRAHSNAMGWVDERIDLPLIPDTVLSSTDPAEPLQRLITGNSPGSPEEPTIHYLCLGPLSTLAHALDTEPELSQQIGRVYFSGTGPDLAPSWNRLCDPEAFSVVLKSAREFLAFARPDEEEPPLSEEFLRRVGQIKSRAARFIAALHQAPSIKGLVRAGHLKFWDDHIVLFLNHPDLGILTGIPSAEGKIYQLTDWNREAAEQHYLGLLSGAPHSN